MKHLSALLSLSPTLLCFLWGLLLISLSSCNFVLGLIGIQKEELKECTVSRSFNGLLSNIATSENNSSQVTNVLVIHGIRYTTSDYADGMIENLTKTLDFPQIPIEIQEFTYKEPTDIAAGPAHLSVRKFVKEGSGSMDTNLPPKELNFYVVHWAEVTKEAKGWVRMVDESQNRTDVSLLAKEELMIDGFGDVLLYTGKFKDNIQKPVIEALLMMNEKQGNISGKNTFMISGSFGSKVVFDVVNNYKSGITLPEEPEIYNKEPLQIACETFEANLNTIFMLSNQLSLLALFDFQPDNKNFGQQLAGHSFCNNDSTRLIAFTDPNDLLGFKIPNPNDNPHIINIELNIAKEKYEIKRKLIKRFNKKDKETKEDSLSLKIDSLLKDEKLDLVLRLDQAHIGSKEDRRVLEMIAKGCQVGNCCDCKIEKE